MKPIKNFDLLCITFLSLVLAVAAVLSGPTALRTVLGIPLILFFPGYLTTTAIFPNPCDLTPLKRVVLSFGLSITVVPMLFYTLDSTPRGITLRPLILLLLLYVFIMSGITEHRRKSLSKGKGLEFSLKRSLHLLKEFQSNKRLLNLGLVVSLLLVALAGVYSLATPPQPEKFTEFYLLGTGGKAAGYPFQVSPEEEVQVTVGIVNHEHTETKYRIELEIDNDPVYTEGPLSLPHGATWEKEIHFKADTPGKKTKGEFILYKIGKHGDVPYRTLFIWMDVSEF